MLEQASPIQLFPSDSKMDWLKVDSLASQDAQVLVFAISVTLGR